MILEIRASIAIFIATIAIAWTGEGQVLAADNPKFIQGMRFRKSEELVRKAGWLKKTKSDCILGNGQRKEDCSHIFPDKFLEAVPSLSGTAADMPLLYTCYEDGHGKTLTLSFWYNEDYGENGDEDGKKLLENLTLAYWTVEKAKKCIYGL
jgi:hypothetical protein